MTMSPMLVFKVAYTRPFFSWAGALIANNAAASHAPIRIILFTLFSSFLSEFCYHFVDESQIHVFRRFALWLGIESDRLPLCHQLDGCKARVLVAHRLENVGDRLFSGKEIRPKVRDHDPVRIIQTFEIVDL